MVDTFGVVAGHAGLAGIPDGQHLALSQLQGDALQRTALAAHHHPVWRAHCIDCVLFAAGPAGVGDALCQHRHRNSNRGYYSPQVPAAAASAAPGASNWYRGSELMAHTHRTGPRTSIAIIGGETLLGK